MPLTDELLGVEEHSRDSAGMTYVYPVISRRAGGVSVGINLNPNNACNWQCVYCQVPGLTRGGPLPIDLGLLGDELDRFLADATAGSFMQQRVAETARHLVDAAFSGNGEPTSANEFPDAVDVVVGILRKRPVTAGLRLRLTPATPTARICGNRSLRKSAEGGSRKSRVGTPAHSRTSITSVEPVKSSPKNVKASGCGAIMRQTFRARRRVLHECERNQPA